MSTDLSYNVMLPYGTKKRRDQLKKEVGDELTNFYNKWKKYLDQQTATALMDFRSWFDDMDKPEKGFLQSQQKQLDYAQKGINLLDILINSINNLYENKWDEYMTERMEHLRSGGDEKKLEEVEEFLQNITKFLTYLTNETLLHYFEILAQYVDGGDGRPRCEGSRGKYMKKVENFKDIVLNMRVHHVSKSRRQSAGNSKRGKIRRRSAKKHKSVRRTIKGNKRHHKLRKRSSNKLRKNSKRRRGGSKKRHTKQHTKRKSKRHTKRKLSRPRKRRTKRVKGGKRKSKT